MRTSEWVSLGHPDKTADSISEYILDRFLENDPNVRYALECQIKNNYVTLSGEITSSYIMSDKECLKWVKEAVSKVGYTKEYQDKWGEDNTICADDLQVITHISQQSPDISTGVDHSGWGDQGIFFGYAENNSQTNYMPLDHYYAKSLGKKLYEMALKPLSIIGLDIKTQVTLDKIDNIIQVIVAVPMIYDCIDDIKEMVIEHFRQYNQDIDEDSIIVNGTGVYKKHGPIADCGTTGRKLAVDLYGGNSKIGGGALVTKDGTKADLTLNLYARELALAFLKRLVPETVHYATAAISCCIGKDEINVTLDAYDIRGYHCVCTEEYIECISPKELIEKYNLTSPNFYDMNNNGFVENI